MTKVIPASEGMKLVKGAHGYLVEVPESTSIGKNSHIYSGVRLGMNCRLGDAVTIEHGSRLGNKVTVGNDTEIQGNSIVMSDVIICSNCNLNGVVIAEDVFISNDVEIGPNTDVRKGVRIPSNWKIPADCIVNPGIDGFPVVIPKPQSFRCNVNGTISTGYR
jgi:NDP-sugar pyrophosphorylase family protein